MTVSVERAGSILDVVLNRPEKRNALTTQLFEELGAAMGEIRDDESVRAVVLAGKGASFSVGLDVHSLATIGGSGEESRSPASRASAVRRQVLRLQSFVNAVADCPVPVIAAIHGYCLGGGIDLVTACDIRLCSADAIFSVRETRMALVADLGSLQRLPPIVGAAHTAELVLTGNDITAHRAEHIGLVNHVLPDQAACLEAAHGLAHEIASRPPLAVKGAKEVLAEERRAEIERGLRFVAAWNAGHLFSDDLAEAAAAFFEKRPPRFTGQ